MNKSLKGTLRLALALKTLKKILADNIPGGLSEGKPPKDFSPEQLAKGIKVETKEHGSFGEEISMDHLVENDEYYDYLEKMEKKMEEDQAKKSNS